MFYFYLFRVTERCLGSIVTHAQFKGYDIKNEPILGYEKGSKERKDLEVTLEKMSSKTENVPIVIGDREICTGYEMHQVMPHNHQHKLAKFYWADEKTIKEAIDTSVKAQKKWDKTPLEERVRIWEKAADLMAGPYRQELNAATMLGQAKTVIQAEIDSAAELIDFIRCNITFNKPIINQNTIFIITFKNESLLFKRGMQIPTNK